MRVLSVGQCAVDHGAISRLLAARFDATTVEADDLDDALDVLPRDSFDLVLVNRVLDRDGGDGLAVIRGLLADDALGETPVALVTNFPDWQDRAVALGAVRGFGKSELTTTAADVLAPILGRQE